MNLPISVNKLVLLVLAIYMTNICSVGCSRSCEVSGRAYAPKVSVDKGRLEGRSDNAVKRLEEDVDHAPQILLEGRNDRRKYVQSLCGRIAKVSFSEDRRRLFRRLQDRVFSIRFEDVGDAFSKDVEKRKEVRSRLGGVYASLELCAEELQWQLMASKANVDEQFEPLFRLHEKMRTESLRVGLNDREYSEGIRRIERLYGVLEKTRMFKSEDFEGLKVKFLKVAGRPIRTLEEASAASAKE